MLNRLLITIFLLVSVFLLPWWLTAFLVIVAIWCFPNFYESMLPALAFDLIYGSQNTGFFGFQFAGSCLVLLAIVLTETLRGQLILSAS